MREKGMWKIHMNRKPLQHQHSSAFARFFASGRDGLNDLKTHRISLCMWKKSLGGQKMKQFTSKLVTNRLQRLRISTLIVLCFMVLGLWMDGRPPQSAPVSSDTLAGLTVALDPGHGGYDGGARARESGVWEKELNLQIARAVEAALVERGAAVTLTRTQDICLSDEGAGKARKRADLQKRLEVAEAAGADVFVSLHLNEYRDRAESGPQVYYQRGADAGRLLAGCLQEALISVLQPERKRSANAGDYYVLRNTSLPAVLVECGFLSNAAEEKQLLDASYHRRIAQAVADGLENWLELQKGL